MERIKEALLDKTHYGLNIFSHILRHYYPGKTVLSLSGKVCKPTKNPFNKNKDTLIITIENNIATYIDTDNAIKEGDVFDFAQLHYKVEGNNLLQAINNELSLHIGETRQFYKPEEYRPSNKEQEIEVPEFSFFKPPITNTKPESVVNLKYIANMLRFDHYKERTATLRSIQDKQKARSFKASKFNYVTFSGIFTKRSDNHLKKHSGLLTLDFDHLSSVKSLKHYLLLDPYFETELLFVSPSGDGLKWIISMDLKQGTHQENFIAISNYINQTYKVLVDKSGKDISRACFLPYDPEAYINPKYL